MGVGTEARFFSMRKKLFPAKLALFFFSVPLIEFQVTVAAEPSEVIYVVAVFAAYVRRLQLFYFEAVFTDLRLGFVLVNPAVKFPILFCHVVRALFSHSLDC